MIGNDSQVTSPKAVNVNQDVNWAFEEIADRECKLCDLWNEAQSICLVGQGPRRCDLMFIGESPGEREDDLRLPFQGRAGERLNMELEKVGLVRAQIFITNAIKCHPPDNRDPTKKEITACLKYLEKEIEIVKPKFILLLGNHAMRAVLKKSGITKYRGKVFEAYGAKVMVTFHPSAVNRFPKNGPYFIEDLRKFKQLVEGTKQTLQPKVIPVRDLNDMLDLVNAIKKTEAIAYDCETSGLAEWVPNSKLYCLGVAVSKERAWCIPYEHPEHVWSREDKVQVDKIIHWILEQANVKRITHNGEFDNRWLRTRGFNPHIDFDTMLAAYLINENTSKSLKPLARTYLGAGFYEDAVDVKSGVLPPLGPLLKYCGEDCCYTWALREVFKPKILADDGLHRVYKHILLPASEVFSYVESTGIYIDRQRLKDRTVEAAKNRSRMVEELDKLVPLDLRKEQEKKHDGHINYNSTPFLRELMYNRLKLPVLDYTEGTKRKLAPDRWKKEGTPSTAEPVIKELKGKHKVVDKLLEYREWQKRLDTFLEPWALWAQYDSRLHASYDVGGTTTGRPSCHDPNFQQTERGEFIRGIVSAMEGFSLISCDLHQAELVIAAIQSGDENLLNVFREGRDVHIETAMMITGLPADKITKDLRKKAKAVNFGFIYGMGWRGFKRYAKLKYDVDFTDEEAQAARTKFFERYPKLLVWHEKQRQRVRRDHYVRSPLGRIRHLPDILSTDKEIRSEAERQAINSPVQAMPPDICMLSMASLFKEMDWRKIRIVGMVHDQLLFECKDNIISEWVPRIKQTVENLPFEKLFGFHPTVPITVDITVSKHWEGED